MNNSNSGAVTGSTRWLLRLEALTVMLAALFAYSKLGFSWGSFALFFFVPDISFLGYLAGARIGAICYNMAHTYIGAVSCVVAGFLLPSPEVLCAGMIWCAHIGFDRALGYGLKYAEGFGYTHLGCIGKLSS